MLVIVWSFFYHTDADISNLKGSNNRYSLGDDVTDLLVGGLSMAMFSWSLWWYLCYVRGEGITGVTYNPILLTVLRDSRLQRCSTGLS